MLTLPSRYGIIERKDKSRELVYRDLKAPLWGMNVVFEIGNIH